MVAMFRPVKRWNAVGAVIVVTASATWCVRNAKNPALKQISMTTVLSLPAATLARIAPSVVSPQVRNVGTLVRVCQSSAH